MWDQGPVSRMFLIPMWHPVLIADLTPEWTPLIGVFISVTTIPAAADIALSTAYASWTEAWGSALQLLLNVVVLITIGALVLRLQRIIWRSRSPAG